MFKQKIKTENSTILRFYKFTKGFRWQLLLMAVCMVVSVGFSYLVPQIIKITVDSIVGDLPFDVPDFILEVIEQNGGRIWLQQNLIYCAILALSFSAFAFLLEFFARVLLAKSSEGTLKRLRDTLFEHIQHLPYDWHNRHQTGDIIQRCTADVELLRNFMSNQLLAVIRTFALLATAIFFMLPMDLTLSFFALSFVPIILIYTFIFYRISAAKFQLADHCEGELTSYAQENFTGVRVVRAFGRENYELERFYGKNEEFSDLWIKLGHVLGWNWGIGDALSLSQFVFVAMLGTYFAVEGHITAGEFLTFVSYNSMLMWPIRNLGNILSELSKTKVSAVRLFDILDAEPEHDSPDLIQGEISGDIVFDNVSFNYLPNVPTLENISFTIPEGTTLGILGATGSGKSTLTYLLTRLYELPQGQGKISIGGRDIRKFPLAKLRRHIGVVLQEPFLFSKTFAQNISDGAKSRDLHAVQAAAKLSYIDDSIQNFAQGYETQIGERGVTISGGQKQRVAIARMLMQDAPVKIFDDSLSAVDMETDAKIRSSIARDVKGTTILIAHRITTIMKADQILVMEKGRIVQHGKHAQLIKQEGIYKRIYDAQKAAVQE